MTRHVAVIDIGKTNAKLALVDAEALTEVSVRKAANGTLPGGPYPHYDVEHLWEFILAGLTELNREVPVDAISVTTHGATAAVLDENGALAMPVLDYEHAGPDTLTAEYDTVRPAFAETGSPRLPGGLNLAAQIFWQERMFPEAFSRVASILTYPQYWGFRLTGVKANEVTSLGCHTDLWDPQKRDFSSLVYRQDWRRLMAPIRSANDRLGPLLPELAERTGLRKEVPVYCGIHDSNASLLPHVLTRKAPFAVVSTGTWVVSMAMGGDASGLDPARDSLINVNALGEPVPSARFMGGREYALLTESNHPSPTEQEVEAVLSRPVLLLPSVCPGSGPFPHAEAAWLNAEGASPGERHAAASFYLAAMTATCLDLIGAGGPVIAEGPFARNRLYVRMLAAATGRPVIADADAATGTSVGAALLAIEHRAVLLPVPRPVEPPPEAWRIYSRRWRDAVLQRSQTDGR